MFGMIIAQLTTTESKPRFEYDEMREVSMTPAAFSQTKKPNLSELVEKFVFFHLLMHTFNSA
jgi:hypothetical protein